MNVEIPVNADRKFPSDAQALGMVLTQKSKHIASLQLHVNTFTQDWKKVQ